MHLTLFDNKGFTLEVEGVLASTYLKITDQRARHLGDTLMGRGLALSVVPDTFGLGVRADGEEYVFFPKTVSWSHLNPNTVQVCGQRALLKERMAVNLRLELSRLASELCMENYEDTIQEIRDLLQ